MSNSTEFFVSRAEIKSFPAAVVQVWLGGELCEWLCVEKISLGSWSDFGWAKLSFISGSEVDGLSIESAECQLYSGREVKISLNYNSSSESVTVESIPIFTGRIEEVSYKLSSANEKLDVIVRDASSDLSRIIVYGQRCIDENGDVSFSSQRKMVFNSSGNANGSAVPVERMGMSYTIFSSSSDQSRMWYGWEIIHYLLCEYAGRGIVRVPGINELSGLCGDYVIRNLDVNGKTVLEALASCCDKMGLSFRFESDLSDSDFGQVLVFYRSGLGRESLLYCQKRGEDFSCRRTNVVKIRSRKHFWPVTHRYIGFGEYEVYEATFDLVKGWDTSKETTDYDIYSPVRNPQFFLVQNIYRKWCLNEAGDYTDEPYNQGEAFDFSHIFGVKDYDRRRRCFQHCLTCDKQGDGMGYYLQASYDSGVSWSEYVYPFEMLTDECGIWLSSDLIDGDTWVALVYGNLRLRITASIRSDRRLSCEVSDGPLNSMAPVRDHLMTFSKQFRYKKRSLQSVFAHNGEDFEQTAELDDSAALYECLRKTAMLQSSVIEESQIETPNVSFSFRPSDKLGTSPESRDILGLKSDNRSVCVVERVVINLVDQCTELKVLRRRKIEL
jgi:hypothetical protein